MTRPLVSIIVPVHNRVDLLPQTLASVAAQTYKHFECVIVNDRTTEELAAAVPGDDRFRVVDLPKDKRGAPAARNFGVARTTGDYVVFLDSDDLLSSYALQGRVTQLEAASDLDFFVNACGMFRCRSTDVPLAWNKLTTSEPDDLRRFLRRDVVWQTTSPTWRRETLGKVGGWDEDCQSGQDREFHVRALLAGLKYRKVQAIDHHWRLPGAQQSIGKSAWKSREHAIAWCAQLRRTTSQVEAMRGTDMYCDELSALWFEAARRLADTAGRDAARRLLREATGRRLLSAGEFTRG
ncbi:MAG: glycosyltransferase family 2 protein, partial [Planctomycetota bacterium]